MYDMNCYMREQKHTLKFESALQLDEKLVMKHW